MTAQTPDPAPPVACGEREQAGATAEPSSPASAGAGHVDGLAAMDIHPR